MQMVRSTDGVELAIHDLGGDGPELLLAHATGFCGPVWAPVARELPFHSVALDFRAHGRSSRPSSGNLDWSGMADDVLTTVDACGLSGCPAAGHSMGGAALLLAEIARPGTFCGLWLFEPIVIPPTVAAAGGDGGNDLSEGARRRRRSFPSRQAALDNFSSKPPMQSFADAALEAYIDGGFEELEDGSVVLRCSPDDEAATYEMGGQHPAYDHLGEVRCPVVVVGSADPYGPAMFARPVAERLPHATFVHRADMNHFGPMEHPRAVASMITEFVDSI